MSTTPISDITPLEPDYIPNEFIDRENPETALSNLLAEEGSRNIHLQGPRGTGKTHLTKSILKELSNTEVNTCYIDSRHADTQYKALKQIYRSLTGQQVNSGHHTSDLQRKIEERTGAIPTVIVVDEIDFLLLNDGESLLYYLSRLNNANTSIITISNHITELQNQIEERTYSSLQPYPIQLEPYTGEETFQILLQRAQQALKPQTLQRDALTYIASTTQNTRLAIQWLKTAATETSTVITENTVQQTREQAYNQCTAQLLDQHTSHHKLLYQAITGLDQKQKAIQAGDVYQRYQELTQNYEEEQLSNRRISDFLKHLELLNLINAEYHYGGKKGKTREIKPRYSTNSV
jgi:orc1/cdc6 family replication initiation protein